jgi:hypothetical protein
VGALAAAGESRLSTILNDSAAWPQGDSCSAEPGPRGAGSYKRLLGLCVCEPEPSTDPRGCYLACPGETRAAATFALPAPKGPAPRGHRGFKCGRSACRRGRQHGVHHSAEPHQVIKEPRAPRSVRQRPNGWRFSCGAEVRLSTILNDSAAWPRGGSWSGEPWPRSADSYKRWLGLGRSEPEPSADARGGNPACQGETRAPATFALPAPICLRPAATRDSTAIGSLAAGGASTELTTERSPTQSSMSRAPTICWTET